MIGLLAWPQLKLPSSQLQHLVTKSVHMEADTRTHAHIHTHTHTGIQEETHKFNTLLIIMKSIHIGKQPDKQTIINVLSLKVTPH